MSITATGDASSILGATTSGSTRQPSAAETAAADQSFQELLGTDDDPDAAAKETLSEITQGGAAGYWAWQVKQMKEEATSQVMAGMGVTPDKIASMSTADRVATEEKIEQLVEQKVKQEIADDSKKKQEQTLAAGSSLHSIITAAQSIDPKTGQPDGSRTNTTKPSDPLDLLFFGS
jgi:hypothetical protein